MTFVEVLAAPRRRRLLVALWLAVALTLGAGLGRLELDSSPEVYFVDEAEELERFRRLEVRFGRDRAVRAVVVSEEGISGDGAGDGAAAGGLWTAGGLRWLGDLETRLAALPGVLGTAGLHRHHAGTVPSPAAAAAESAESAESTAAAASVPKTAPVAAPATTPTASPWPPADPDAFRRRVLADPVDRGAGWVSADGSVATVLVALPRLAPREQRRVLAEAEALLAHPPPGIDAFLAGLPVVQAALEAEGRALLRRFFPALVAFVALVLLAAFRRPRQVAAVLLFVAVAEAGTLGAMGWAGGHLDMVNLLLVPLLLVVATATAVHLLVRFRQLRGRGLEAPRAAAELVRQKGWPVVWGGLTTAAGFGSLAVASAPAVRALGAWAAFGFLWTLVAALTLLPSLLAEDGRPATRRPGNAGMGSAGAGSTALGSAAIGRQGHDGGRRALRALHRLGRRGAAAAVARRRAVLAAFALLALVAAAGVLRLRTESNVVSYLAPEHPVRSRLALLEARGLGVVSADLVLALPRGGEGFRSPERLARLERLAERLRRHPLPTGVLSAADLLASWRRPGETGAAGWRQPLERARTDRRDAQALGFLLTAGGDQARVTLQVPMAGAGELEALFATARREAAAAFPDAEAWVTGRYPLVVRSQRALLPTMVRSLGLATLLVAAALWWAMRRGPSAGSAAGSGAGWAMGSGVDSGVGSGVGLALRALVANLWPVLVALGVMGWCGVPLDSSTVAVAAVALGLVVDDTFHTFADFRRQLPRRGARRAVVAALGRNAPAHVATAVLLAGGFALFAVSGLVPAARFGPLTAVAILAALAADLLLVPALLAGHGAGTRQRP